MSTEQDLEKDLIWREAELASLKRLIITTTWNDVINKGLLRAIWALLYAHFEGFTKFCWDSLFDHIQHLSVPISELNEKFAIISMESQFRCLRGNMSSEQIFEFYTKEMPLTISLNAVFPDKLRLKTESNLWPNIFERETGKIGISCQALNNNREKIKTLVSRRNDIAHGKSMTIKSLQEYKEYEDAVMHLMYDLALQTIEVIDRQLYLRPEYRSAPPSINS